MYVVFLLLKLLTLNEVKGMCGMREQTDGEREERYALNQDKKRI